MKNVAGVAPDRLPTGAADPTVTGGDVAVVASITLRGMG